MTSPVLSGIAKSPLLLPEYEKAFFVGRGQPFKKEGYCQHGREPKTTITNEYHTIIKL